MSKRLIGKRYYLVFEPRSGFKWWDVFTSKQFAHVWYITAISKRTSLVFNTTTGKVNILKVNRSVKSIVNEEYNKGNVIATYRKTNEQLGLNFFVSCVGFGKYLLGINKWWIWTPKQLYKECFNVYKKRN